MNVFIRAQLTEADPGWDTDMLEADIHLWVAGAGALQHLWSLSSGNLFLFSHILPAASNPAAVSAGQRTPQHYQISVDLSGSGV